MAGKPIRMSQIKQLIRLRQQGKGKKHIAQRLGMSKNTVKAYLQKIEDLPVSNAELLAMEDPQLEAKLHGGNPAYKDLGYLMEIMEDHQARAFTIIAGQLPVGSWYEVIAEETIADAIPDRFAHTAHRLELKGESLRRKQLQK